jgi:hypothetical protein
MATGREMKLTGAVGEFLVAAELCRLGLMATPFAGNVPHYDIIASGQNGGHLAIQVKAINGSAWQFDIRQFMKVDIDGARQVPRNAMPLPYPNLQVVLVALANAKRSKDRFFVMSWVELRNIINLGYRRYLRRHHGIRPKVPGSFHTAVSERDITEYEDRWKILKSALRQ